MKYVYLLRSVSRPEKTYVGATTDFSTRLRQHNDGKSTYTNKFAPWQEIAVVRFQNDERADAFERYLKSGSGHAFAKRHLW